MKKEVMEKFVHEFMENEGVPTPHTRSECIFYLKDVLYCSEEESRAIIEQALEAGFIFESSLNTYI